MIDKKVYTRKTLTVTHEMARKLDDARRAAGANIPESEAFRRALSRTLDTTDRQHLIAMMK